MPSGNVRKGLLLNLDLEKYDFRANSKALIRPTEQTVVSRLPIRIEVRQGLRIESPHVMILIDD